MEVRVAVSSDAEQIIKVMKDAEASNFMMYGPGERELTAEQFQRFIESMNGKEHSAVFAAEEKDSILGYLIMQGETKPKRVSHKVSVAIGVHSESRGKGVGRALFEYAHNWAKARGIHRVELTVISKNEQAYSLYKKLGYETEGVKKHSLFIDGEYVDEYYMAKLL